MKLDRVTITGADDSVDPLQLRALSLEFPFVEWGILVSHSNTICTSYPKPRFPSPKWIADLQGLVSVTGHVPPSHAVHHTGE